MSEPYLKAFEEKDLYEYFRKYAVEEFVQRNLRRVGFNTVADILAFDETEFQVWLSKENQKVQERGLTLYKALQREKDRIVYHHSRIDQKKTSSEAAESSDYSQKQTVSTVPADTPGAQNSPPGLESGAEVVAQGVGAQEDIKAAPTGVTHEPHVDVQPAAASVDLPPIRLGQVIHRDRFHTERTGEYRELPYTEEGLRRHVLIAGSTGSGKTVAARYIVEQAAISGVPSIVVDAQGDISSLVLAVSEPEARALFEKVSLLQKPETRKEEEDLTARITKHLDALSKHRGSLSRLYAKRCLPRIFTPGRPDLGLPISLPPYLDILAAYSDEPGDELQQHELDEPEPVNRMRHFPFGDYCTRSSLWSFSPIGRCLPDC